MKTWSPILLSFATIAFSFAFQPTPVALADTCTDACASTQTSCVSSCSGDITCEAGCSVDYTSCTSGCTTTSSTTSSSTEACYTISGDVFTTGIVFAGVNSCCRASGDCSLDDVMQVFVNISNFVLGIVGSLTLALFVYGGLRWLISQGNPDGIKAGRKAMVGSVIGLLIVFGAFTGITIVTSVLRGGTIGQENLCELVSPEEGGRAGLGYACIDITGLDTVNDYSCAAGLCPSQNINVQCCKSAEDL